jgi:valyl-tRNA synthetase
VIVARETPLACPKCHATTLRPETDTLDTWFSSALWPFATLGWPEETDDLAYFYPTSALVTARDIIFLWVARMIMFGLEFRGEVPFRHVYINPTVLNIEGKRMSKSLGTGIDPLDLVDRYGSDSMRFALINRCTGEQDLRFSEKMVEDTRNFANKIWNAARFVRLSLGDLGAGPAGRTLPDRWIVSRFARAAADVSAALEGFEFRDACASLYTFVWSEFCDWYVEMAKANLRAGGAVADGTRRVLATVLSDTMALLHPIMPALTEEIWQALPHTGETIMRAAWPVPEDRGARADWLARLRDEDAERAMDEVMGLVHAVRGMRADLGLAPTDGVPVVLFGPDDRRALLERQGFQVLLAKDGVDALRQMQDALPDVLLVDIEMPRMDGYDLTRNVRSNKTTRQIPIIMITSRTAEKHRRVAIELGVNEYLGKPYREDELLDLIHRYVQTSSVVRSANESA